MTNPAAWHPDPTSAHEYRWWDGERWTEHVADGGQASIDPLAGSAGPSTQTADAAGAGTHPGTGTESGAETGGSSAATGSERDTGTSATAAWQQPEASEPAAAGQPAQSWQPSEQPVQSWQQPSDQAGAGGQAPTWQQTPTWQQPGAQTPAAPASNGVATAAMIIGILTLILSWLPPIGFIGGILALVLGFVGRKKAKQPNVGGNGPAITGIVTGILSVVIAILATVAIFAFGSTFMGSIETYEECIEQGGSPDECEQQLEDDILGRFGQ